MIGEGAPIGRYRWSICALLFCVITVNYVDRQVIGVLKPIIEKDMRWSEVDYGNIVTAFQASYGVGMKSVDVNCWPGKMSAATVRPRRYAGSAIAPTSTS